MPALLTTDFLPTGGAEFTELLNVYAEATGEEEPFVMKVLANRVARCRKKGSATTNGDPFTDDPTKFTTFTAVRPP